MTIKSSDIPTPNDGGPAFPNVRIVETFAMKGVEGGKKTKNTGDLGQSKRDVFASRFAAALTARMALLNEIEAKAVAERAASMGATSVLDYIAKQSIAQADALLNNLAHPPLNFDELNEKIEVLTTELSQYKRLMPTIHPHKDDGGGIQFGNVYFSFDAITGYNDGPGAKRDHHYLSRITANQLLRWANAVAALGKPGPGLKITGDTTSLLN